MYLLNKFKLSEGAFVMLMLTVIFSLAGAFVYFLIVSENSREIGDYRYKYLEELAAEHEQVHPMIAAALEDGKIVR